MANGLYLSGWNPDGASKEWERTSMDRESSGDLLRSKGVPDRFGDPVEAVGWFMGDWLRVLVADYSNGRRITLRVSDAGYLLEYDLVTA
ncbi:hypothetical protein SAMN06295912_102283 [Sphingomonas laterariae]|uniref:Uncharacterized protein n=1 Tax=Edaphosphingomonas laterariae TaxID=861865 RepID=A0A239CMJ0_9SPHN|nr:hypothetical protein [Sphingomonas laterariae]SNS21092.1 hypothetical protein SAMN06295912_102283 [Sphingomonas laterariae]